MSLLGRVAQESDLDDRRIAETASSYVKSQLRKTGTGALKDHKGRQTPPLANAIIDAVSEELKGAFLISVMRKTTSATCNIDQFLGNVRDTISDEKLLN